MTEATKGQRAQATGAGLAPTIARGLALFLSSGLAAWMAAWRQLVAASSSPPPVGPCRDHQLSQGAGHPAEDRVSIQHERHMRRLADARQPTAPRSPRSSTQISGVTFAHGLRSPPPLPGTTTQW